jgi:hypothetical protein
MRKRSNVQNGNEVRKKYHGINAYEIGRVADPQEVDLMRKNRQRDSKQVVRANDFQATKRPGPKMQRAKPKRT